MSKNKKQRRKAMLDNLASSLYEEPTARLKNESIEKIRSEGFIIFSNPDFGPNHIGRPNGYHVSRPREVLGNSLQNYESNFTDENGNELTSDGPSPCIYSNSKGGWSVAVHECIPGPGPGDFDCSFEDEVLAVDEVIRYLKGVHDKFVERKAAHEKEQT